MAVEAEARRDAFLASALPTGAWELEPLVAGGNNRTFLAQQGNARYVLKEYFRHPGDPRDRAGAEFAFARFAWGLGLRCLPEPISCDVAAGIGLFRFVEGERIAPGTVGRCEVEQAMGFITELNRHRRERITDGLPEASEACFTLGRHLELVRCRLERLEQMPETGTIEQEALDFVREDVRPVFARITERIRREARRLGMGMDEELAAQDRVISPSDFGFHNTLRRKDGSLVFLDFEYAGWDDPAKLTGDFFSQVQVPVPLEQWEFVCDATVSIVVDRDIAKARMDMLLPLYRLKWCCIVLNHFLPVSASRRSFAGQDSEGLKRNQLSRAKTMLQAISSPQHST